MALDDDVLKVQLLREAAHPWPGEQSDPATIVEWHDQDVFLHEPAVHRAVQRHPAGAILQVGGPSLDFLASGGADLPPSQRSMRAVLDHSWRLLSPRLAQVLAALSVLEVEFAREAAQEVAGASLQELRDLADQSLLQQVGWARYALSALLQPYAAEKLAHSRAAKHEADARLALFLSRKARQEIIG